MTLALFDWALSKKWHTTGFRPLNSLDVGFGSLADKPPQAKIHLCPLFPKSGGNYVLVEATHGKGHISRHPAEGQTEERMHLLDAWREAPVYSARERAALGWIEAITLVTQGHVPDEAFEVVRKQFSEKEIVDPQVESKKAAA